MSPIWIIILVLCGMWAFCLWYAFHCSRKASRRKGVLRRIEGYVTKDE